MSIKVAVRVRPFNQREIDMKSQPIVEMDGKKTRLMKSKLLSLRDSGRDNFNDFTFDHSYWSFDDTDSHFATQEQVFEDLGTDVIDCAFQGYNACVFAYGQTGSGKSYTMMGSPDMQGLIPRICKSLFARIKLGQESGTGFKTNVSYLEIYNERVKDLLGIQSTGHGLKVREHRTSGPYVENLSQHCVDDYKEIQDCINKGNIQRTTASTNMNDTSSRSHAIFTITFVQAGFFDDLPRETVSKIHLVDLAGSERANATGATGQRLKEGAHINKSLVTLGSVISALAEQTNPTNQKKVLYIPYRDSTLTWLLKDSLGGNSKTIMIAAISPADCNYSETLSTLRYANRAKNIINKPTINEDTNVKLIRELRDEIYKLKSMLDGSSTEPALKVLEDLQKKEAQEKVLTEEWTEKWREAQSILREQKSLGLKKLFGGVVLDSESPHLIGIHDDISTGVTLYSLKDGETLIGTDEAFEPQDIVLSGIGICHEHCSIILKNGNAMIYPKASAQCMLNANVIEEPMAISQGDILLLGRTNMFRYNNPAEAAKLRSDPSRSRLNLSRLSLIAASRENLNTSLHCFSDDDLLFTSPMKRSQYYPSEQFSRDAELQDEHKKILETIENALKQLNIERSFIHQQYKNKVKKLSNEFELLEKSQNDQIEMLNCKEHELMARKEMLTWEKVSEKTQVEIVDRQISALQTQLDLKKRDFYEYVAKELQELQDFGKLDEIMLTIPDINLSSEDSSDILLEASNSLDAYSSQCIKDIIKRNRNEIEQLETDLECKETLHTTSNETILRIDRKLAELEEEIRKLTSKRTQQEIEEIQIKKQSFNLDLKTNSNESDALQTCDTFHTANSNCSFPTSSPPFLTAISDSTTIDDKLMIDSGVCLDSQKTDSNLSSSTPLSKDLNKNLDDDNNSCSSFENSNCLSSYSEGSTIHNLRKKIAVQKAQIMKNLEMGTDKSELDRQIEDLQSLQKDYIKMEMAIDQIRDGTDVCLSDGDINADNSLSITDSEESRLPQSSAYSNREMLESSYAPSLTRSLPSIRPYQDSEHTVSIPGFVIRGAGKKTHFEYEIRISIPNEKWLLLRRYSRFRELHLNMKNCYGEKIAAIPFPRRELFSSNSENVARNRRRQLETYLRRLIVVCSKVPQCPIYEGQGGYGVTKHTLIEFSPFFKKGLFESGKHGTG